MSKLKVGDVVQIHPHENLSQAFYNCIGKIVGIERNYVTVFVTKVPNCRQYENQSWNFNIADNIKLYDRGKGIHTCKWL